MDEHVQTVAELTASIKHRLEGDFDDVWVAGEIVGLKHHGSGHIYFTLKDDRARLNGVIFRNQIRFLALRPEEMREGMALTCHGRLSVYEPHGAYSLVVDQLQASGLGPLLQRLEELKQKLSREGLFDPARKRPLPFLPRCIGIVTSETSAAIRDMLRIIEGRYPSHVKLYPAVVQGDAAAADIVRGLRLLDADEEVDVLIVGRGGGAFEDLLPFSDEQVVRAVAACGKPVISAVGHEIDTPLCDFAADVRAPTPTAAGQMVVPEAAVLGRQLEDLQKQLVQATERRGVDCEFALAETWNTLAEAASSRLQRAESRVATRTAALAAAHPAARLGRVEQRFAAVVAALDTAVARTVERKQARLARAGDLLEQVSPRAQLKRGYSLVRRPNDGKAVVRAAEVRPGERVEIVLYEGRLVSEVLETH
jgi:exodeoxyribonuclease VII large subunit